MRNKQQLLLVVHLFYFYFILFTILFIESQMNRKMKHRGAGGPAQPDRSVTPALVSRQTDIATEPFLEMEKYI